MKRYSLYMIVGLLSLTSCEDVFYMESTSVVVDNGERIEHPGDSLYSVMGILSQFQRLGERFVLLGELRGDLMSATNDAIKDLQDIADFSVTEGNIYADRMDYYSVINNCNFALERMDTSLVDYQTKVLLPEYAAIRGLRAWTYWHMALAFGEVRYIDKPLLTLESTLADYPVKGIEEMAELLIDDLTPYLGVRHLDYGSVDGIQTRTLFVPLLLFVADLHLFLNHYDQAAQLYYDYIRQHHLTISEGYSNDWNNNTRTDASMPHTSSYTGEMLFQMAYSSDARDYHPSLIHLAYNTVPSIVPASSFVEAMRQRTYFFTPVNGQSVGAYFLNDLRGQAFNRRGSNLPAAYGTFSFAGGQDIQLINKYNYAQATDGSGYDPLNEANAALNYTRQLPLLRTPHVYLRFAEALNRLGKPSLAFAVLKYGLTEETLADTLKVSPWELQGEAYTDFSWSHTYGDNRNVGTARRGLGRGVSFDKDNYTIGEQASLQDSITVVEEMILDEMAAETAFEGNRFFDLLRVSRHRGQWPAFAAKRVSLRLSDHESAQIRLEDDRSWWLRIE
ncbi:MAG: RagB/SusD family nutrient uptake outer membrane protein [Bacteroidaceae bacterium]|nr:RagB/SusD family nutrient uptake outer membrane protein [Bacteroidaceae bacterium]